MYKSWQSKSHILIDHIPIPLLSSAFTQSEMDPIRLLASSAIDDVITYRPPKSTLPKSARPKATCLQTASIPIPISRNQWRESREVQSSYDSGCEADCDSESDGGLESDNSDMAGPQCHPRTGSVECLWCQFCNHQERFFAEHFTQLPPFQYSGPFPLQAMDSGDTASFSMSYSSSWSMTEN